MMGSNDFVPAKVRHPRTVQILGRVIALTVGHIVNPRDDPPDLCQLTLDGLHPFFLDNVFFVRKTLRHVFGQNIQVIKDDLQRVIDPMPETDR